MVEDDRFKKLTPKQKEMVAILNKPANKRVPMDNQLLVPLIQSINFFKEREITQDNAVMIAETLSYEYMTPQTTVFYQGDQGDKFYIIIEGEVSVKIQNKVYESKRREVANMQA